MEVVEDQATEVVSAGSLEALPTKSKETAYDVVLNHQRLRVNSMQVL